MHLIRVGLAFKQTEQNKKNIFNNLKNNNKYNVLDLFMLRLGPHTTKLNNTTVNTF